MKRLLSLLAAVLVLGSGISAHALGTSASWASAGDGTWSRKASAMGGQTVLCRSEVTMPSSGEGVFLCHLSRGLDFDAVISVERQGEPVNAAYYTVVTARQEEAAFALHVSPQAAEPGERLRVAYTLTLNDDAREENTFVLCPPGEKGEEGVLRLYSLTALRAWRVPETGQMNPVAEACLCLSRDPMGRDRVAFRQRGEDTYFACTAEGCPHSRHLYVLKTPRNGRVYLEGLSAGTYYLCETRPAEGMTETAESLEVTVTEEGEVLANGALCPERVAALTHTAGEAVQETRRFTLADFYRRGSQLLATALLVLIAARRYYL